VDWILLAQDGVQYGDYDSRPLNSIKASNIFG